VNLIAEKGNRVVKNILKVSIISSFLVAVSALLYYFGIDSLSFIGKGMTGANLVGSDLRILAIYLSAMIFISLYDFTSSHKHDLPAKVFDFLAILLALVLLVLIGWNLAWLVFFAILLVSVLIGKFSSEKKYASHGGILTIFLLVFSLVFVLSGINLDKIKSGQVAFQDSMISDSFKGILKIGDKGSNPNETLINENTSKTIALQSLKASPVLGSGIGTYSYDFDRYKDAGFNYDQNWNMRFGKAYNEILEKVSTIGLLGVLAYLFLAIVALFVAFANLKKEKKNVFLFAALLTLLVFQFLFLEAAIIKFLFILFLAVISGMSLSASPSSSDKDAVFESKKIGKLIVFNVGGKGAKSAFTSFAFVIFAVLAGASLIFAVQSFRAEAKYKEISQRIDVENINSNDLETVLKLNPYSGEYQARISAIYELKLNKFVSFNKDDQASVNQIKDASDKALSHAKQAVEISPSDAAFWENYGYVYRKMFEFGMDGADTWAIKGFKTASQLEPTNAVMPTEIGKMSMLQFSKAAEGQNSPKLAEAKADFEKAVLLKKDYPDALTQLALVYFESGDKENALSEVNIAAQQKKISVETAVQIGKIYYNLDEKAKAADALSAVIKVSPKNSDAHYILGIIYKEQKKYPEAFAEFKTVAELNPGNVEVSGKVQETESLIGSKNLEK
jgi:tetratricopeptide (TPR) repeat protein